MAGNRRVVYPAAVLRVLPQRSLGELPFERSPHYTHDHLTTLESLGYDFSSDRHLVQGDWMETPDSLCEAAGAMTAGLALFLSLVAIAVVLSWPGQITL